MTHTSKTPRSHKSCTTRGFSLLELMVVVVILGTLAAFSAPAIIKSIERNNARSEARAISNIFQHARSLASANGQPVLVTVSADGKTIDLHHTGTPGVTSCSMTDASTPPAGNLIQTYTIGSRYPDATITHNGGIQVLCFSPSGRLLQAGSNRPFSNPDRSPAGCVGMNFLLWLHRTGETLTNEASCIAHTDTTAKGTQKDNREMKNFFMIHIPYASHAEVLQ